VHRKEDIIPLSYHFLNSFSSNYNKQVTNISTQAEAALLHYDYPGNVRELRNLIEKLVIFSTSNEIGLSDIYNIFSSDKIKTPNISESITNLKEAKREFEKDFITKMLNDNDWKIKETAYLLGIDRTNLFKKMQSLNVKR
jgi:two-component system nitrogen regulation response regulator NtrX